MKNKRTLTLTIAVVAIAILAAFGIFKPCYSQDTAPNDMTHLGVREKEVVNLQSTGSWYYKVARDGAVMAQSTDNRYIVPIGRVLVITDFTASFGGRQRTNARVSIFQNDGLGNVRDVWRRPEKIDSNGWGWVDSHWTSGLVTNARGGISLQVAPEFGNVNNVISWIAGYEVDASTFPQ